MSKRVVRGNFPFIFVILHMILIACGITRFFRFIFIMTLISRLLLSSLRTFAWSGPYTFRIGFVPVWSSWAWWIISFLVLLIRNLDLLLTLGGLILFIHEVYIVFFFVVERSLELLLTARIIRRIIARVLVWMVFILELCRTTALATNHSFKVLECYHHYSDIVQWLSHQAVL